MLNELAIVVQITMCVYNELIIINKNDCILGILSNRVDFFIFEI